MSNNQTPFMAQTVLLDGFIKSEDPTADAAALEVVIAVLRDKPELRQYFFRSQPKPAWANVLLDKGFLTDAPTPETEDEKVRFPYWDAQEYLISVAQYVPHVVLDHLRNIKGHAWYRGRAMLAIQFIPPAMVSEIMPTVLHWMADREFVSIVSDHAYQLMLALAKKKNPTALDIFRNLTTPGPSQRLRQVSGYTINTEATSVLPHLRWDREADNLLMLLNEIDATQVATILESQLCTALRIEADAKQAADYEFKLSSWWRSAIESTSQDLRQDYKDDLLEALRDTVEFLATHDRAESVEVLRRYSIDPHEILRRLRLHVLGKFPSEFEEEVRQELLSEANFDDTGLHHEFFMLLNRGFAVLSDEQRELLLEIIFKGPPKENLERFIEWVNGGESEQREPAVQDYIKRWIRDRLSMIAEHLDEARLAVFKRLTEELGEPEHPDFTSWTGEAFAVADVSPLSNEQLALMTPTELLGFLRQWQPDRNRMFGPEVVSYRGLGKAVAAVIESQPMKYREHFVSIGVMRPEFAYALLGEQRLDNETVSNISEDVWSLYFDLSEAMLADDTIATDMGRANEINWRDARSAIVTFIDAALKNTENEESRVPANQFSRVRDILLRLTKDPDPVIEEEQSETFPDRDPATSALNHIRSKALGTLIEKYSVHVARSKQARGLYGEIEGPGPNRLEPEIEEVLAVRLRRNVEPSLAVHSVYGRALTILYWLNQTWLQDHIADVFPEGEDLNSAAYFVAAWDSYVVFNRPHYKELFELLSAKYVRAIDNLAKGLVTRTHLEPDRSLAAHVLGNYLYGNFDLNSPEGQNSLIVLFFSKAPADARGSAIWILWNTFKSYPEQKDRLWPKAREIWKWRVDVASSKNHSTDFDSEMSWFPYLLEFAPKTESITSIWPLLEGILPHIGRARRFSSEWEEIEKYLIREVETEPVKVIRFYRLMHEVAGRPAWFLEHNERKLLERGLKHKESRDATLSVIDLIGSMGDLSYRELYEEYTR
jgi:hypothetical protein